VRHSQSKEAVRGRYPSADVDVESLRRQLRRFGATLRRFQTDIAAIVEDTRPVSVASDVIEARRALARFVAEHSHFEGVSNLPEDRLLDLRADLTRLACRAWLQPYLEQSGIPTPAYNTYATFEQNVSSPWEPIPTSAEARTPADWTLLRYPIRYPLGVPASSLTSSSDWIEFYARKGFNVLTFKTVGGAAKAPYTLPNWVFIEDRPSWQTIDEVGPVRADVDTWPRDFRDFSTANSFGVPSTEPYEWQQEIKECLSRLDDGQLLIVSVIGNPDAGSQLIDDFANVAGLAVQAGARAVELNLSCPNALLEPQGIQPPICEDPVSTARIVEAVRRVVAPEDVRLVAKLGYLRSDELERLVIDCGVGEMVDGVSGINTVQTRVVQQDGTFTFGGRDKAGISGAAIRPLGLEFCSHLDQLRSGKRLSFDIIAMGGVMAVEDVASYFDAGADAVQSATGALYNPDLAAEVQLQRAEDNPQVIRNEHSRWRVAREVLTTGRIDLLRT
jgi:dihydroorotate dehydrogenase